MEREREFWVDELSQPIDSRTELDCGPKKPKVPCCGLAWCESWSRDAKAYLAEKGWYQVITWEVCGGEEGSAEAIP